MSSSNAFRVAGDDLPAFLESGGGENNHVRVSPPPRSWAAIKPEVMGLLRERRDRGRLPPRFAGYPLCAVGINDTSFPVLLSPDTPAPAPCARCGMRPHCSPPDEWHPELSPFGPRDEFLL